MSAPIEEQLRDYFTMVDRMQGPIDTTPQAPDAPTLSLVNDSHDSSHTNEPTSEVIMLTPNRNESPTTNHRWMMVAAAIVLVGGLIFATTRADEDPVPVDQVDPAEVSCPSTTSGRSCVLVPGTKQWTDTGINLSIGDTVSIEADGAITPDVLNMALHGPDGVPDRPSVRGNVEGLEEENHNGLIGRIGEVGAPFQVGSQLQFIADTEGRLFLGINDTYVADNAGVFTVTITVNPS